MSSPIVEVRQLTKRFGDFTAVDQVSFNLQPGETIGLLGPNGAGKSTFINILGGLCIKSSGQVNVWGFDLDKNP